jgi:hypothetical protein
MSLAAVGLERFVFIMIWSGVSSNGVEHVIVLLAVIEGFL